jgi:hypothetical protein
VNIEASAEHRCEVSPCRTQQWHLHARPEFARDPGVSSFGPGIEPVDGVKVVDQSQREDRPRSDGIGIRQTGISRACGDQIMCLAATNLS